MQNYIDSCRKEPEIHTTYSKHITARFENKSYITINRGSVIPQEKQNEIEKL